MNKSSLGDQWREQPSRCRERHVQGLRRTSTAIGYGWNIKGGAGLEASREAGPTSYRALGAAAGSLPSCTLTAASSSFPPCSPPFSLPLIPSPTPKSDPVLPLSGVNNLCYLLCGPPSCTCPLCTSVSTSVKWVQQAFLAGRGGTSMR